MGAKAGLYIDESGVVLAAGTPIIVYGINIVASGGNGLVSIYNNSISNQDPLLQLTGEDGKRTFIPFPGGITFTEDCYVDLGTNISFAVLVYEKLMAVKPLYNPGDYATGTITAVSYSDLINGDSIEIGTLTLVVGDNLDISSVASNDELATAIASAITAQSNQVSASALGPVVTITALAVGAEYNNVTLVKHLETAGALTLSGAHLTGGVTPVPAT